MEKYTVGNFWIMEISWISGIWQKIYFSVLLLNITSSATTDEVDKLSRENIEQKLRIYNLLFKIILIISSQVNNSKQTVRACGSNRRRGEKLISIIGKSPTDEV